MVLRTLGSDAGNTRFVSANATTEIDDLWKEALREYEALSKTQLQSLPIFHGDHGNAPLSPQGVVAEIIKPFEDFNAGPKKELTALQKRLRTTLDAIFNRFDVIDRFADLAKNVAFPPAQVIAGTIYVLFKASKDQAAELDLIVNTLEQIQFFIQRLELSVEGHVLQVSHELKRIFILILRDILLICGRLVRLTQGNRKVKGYFRNLFVGRDAKLEDICAHLTTLVNEEARLVNLRTAVTIESVHLQLQNLQLPSSSDQSATSSFSSSARSLRQIRQFLEPVNVDSDLVRLRKDLLRGTADWFVKSDAFETWQSQGGLLWVHGLPGVGKSTLAGFVTDKLVAEDSSQVAYFFCRYDVDKKRDPKCILRTFAFQMAERDKTYREEMLHLSDSGVAIGSLDLMVLWHQLVDQPLRKLSNTSISWIIDGLDELSSTDQIDVAELLATLSPSAAVRVLLVSRQHVACSFVLSRLQVPVLSIGHRDNADAIAKYCQLASSHLPLGDLQEKFAETLQTRSCGIFLWVRLVTDRVRGEDTAEGVWKILEECPEDLGSLYERILYKLSQEKSKSRRTLIQKLFDWVVNCLSPLNIAEMTIILGRGYGNIVDIRKAISTFSGGLVMIENDGTIGLIHYTIREFLQTRSMLNSSVRDLLDPQESHARITSFCYDYFDQPGVNDYMGIMKSESLQRMRDAFPVLEYATMWHAVHCTSVKTTSSHAKPLVALVESHYKDFDYLNSMNYLSLANVDRFLLSNNLQLLSYWRARVIRQETSNISPFNPLDEWHIKAAKGVAAAWLELNLPYPYVWGAYLNARAIYEAWAGRSVEEPSELSALIDWAIGDHMIETPTKMHNLAHVLWYYHSTESALKKYTTASDRDPRNKDFALDAALALDSESKPAEDYWKRALDGRSPVDDERYAALRKFWLRRRARRVDVAMEPAAIEKQIQIAEARVADDPYGYGAYSDLGNLNFISENYLGAIEVYKRTIEHFPAKVWVRNMMGNCYKMLGDDSNADTWFKEAAALAGRDIKHNPSVASHHTLLGHALFGLGEFDKASQEYETALTMVNVGLTPHAEVRLIHVGVYCDGPPCRKVSNEKEIRGPKFSCKECVNFDICFLCWKEREKFHDPQHRNFLMVPRVASKVYGDYLRQHFPELGEIDGEPVLMPLDIGNTPISTPIIEIEHGLTLHIEL